jgi:hypothetical protein
VVSPLVLDIVPLRDTERMKNVRPEKVREKPGKLGCLMLT